MVTLSPPSLGRITEAFGPRPKPTPTSPPFHYGVDYGWGNGYEIFAAAPGKVKATQANAGAYGRRTIIEHEPGVETWYCHQSEFLVTPGASVTRGQHIGTQGATGNVTGVHLHFELRIDGVAVDPIQYMSGTAGGGTLIPSNPERKRAAMSSYPVLIQNTEVSTPEYGLVVKLGDNGEYHWLTAAQRDAWVMKGVEVWECTFGHYRYFIDEQETQRRYFTAIADDDDNSAPAAPSFNDGEIKALIAGIPAATVQAFSDKLS